MKNHEYLLSVIIPTKNRQEFAFQAIEQILTVKSEKIQLIIQDNSDDNTLEKKIVNLKNDTRLKYNYNGEILSFVVNFSQALDLAEGKYICFIGDDDGVLPDIIPVTEWMDKNNIDALVPSYVSYVWPSAGKYLKNKKLYNGYLFMGGINNKCAIKYTEKSLMALMAQGGQNYLKIGMIKLYHGIVKKEYMDDIKNITGYYFGGLSPDIYASTALSIKIKKVIKTNYPLTIAGICEKSGSADGESGKHIGKLEDAPHLKGHSSYDWSEQVPPFYSVETIWADSTLHALKDLKENKYINMFQTTSICMYCKIKYPQFKNIILSYQKKYKINNISIFILYIKLKGSEFIKRVYKRLIRKKRDVITGVPDIFDAEKKIVENLDRANINLNNTLKNLDYIIKK